MSVTYKIDHLDVWVPGNVTAEAMRHLVDALSIILDLPSGLDWKPFDEVWIDGAKLAAFVDHAVSQRTRTHSAAYRHLLEGVLAALVVISTRCGNSHDVTEPELAEGCTRMDRAMNRGSLP